MTASEGVKVYLNAVLTSPLDGANFFATLSLVSTEQKAAWAPTSLGVLAKKQFLAFAWN
jgi:hypothetical protein